MTRFPYFESVNDFWLEKHLKCVENSELLQKKYSPLKMYVNLCAISARKISENKCII